MAARHHHGEVGDDGAARTGLGAAVRLPGFVALQKNDGINLKGSRQPL